MGSDTLPSGAKERCGRPIVNRSGQLLQKGEGTRQGGKLQKGKDDLLGAGKDQREGTRLGAPRGAHRGLKGEFLSPWARGGVEEKKYLGKVTSRFLQGIGKHPFLRGHS